MPEIELKRLRNLRRNAQALSATLVSDLKPFRHPKKLSGFFRKPDSPTDDPNDVNVTTTCSCLMALALTGKLGDSYGSNSKSTLAKTFAKLVNAAWMSSGLAENNAFTTTLVLRLFGFLVESEALATTDADKPGQKLWESRLSFSNFPEFAKEVSEKKDPVSDFLFRLFPEPLQKALISFVSSGTEGEKAEKATISELERLIRSTPFDDLDRFQNVKPSSEIAAARTHATNAYNIAQLNRILLHESYAVQIEPLERKSLKGIALEMSSRPDRFGINDYPPAAAVLYWFFDGVARANIQVPENHWDKACDWAADEFRRQRSLAVAKHAAMMDPVAMAMAACLCARLHAINNAHRSGMTKNYRARLPSSFELERSIVDLFDDQTLSGIWPKYFPLFHYQDAGSNYCFTFELLEAVLVEFGGKSNRLLAEEAVILGLERAVLWCDTNRLHSSEDRSGKPTSFDGWNSGGNLETLRRGQPESWATAVVHMFLSELVEVLSRHIQNRLLDSYAARKPSEKWKPVKNLLDIELWWERRPASLKSTLDETILKTFRPFRNADSEKLRKKPIRKAPLSALLFGPPGTSKTEVAKAIATELNWALVEIDPSTFLQNSFQNIYVQAERIFEDVMDMTGVVVLFDEMDALVQKRNAPTAIDTEGKFLTTYMLPKLARLHDQGRVIFLVATNFQADFDDAIKRAGRFDLLLCMGPPTLRAKCDAIHVFYGLDDWTDETRDAGKHISEYAATNFWLSDQLSLYTYDEFLSFITGIDDAKSIGKAVKNLGKGGFTKQVREDSKTVTLKLDDLTKLKKCPRLRRWKRLRDLDAIAFTEDELKRFGIDIKIPAIKYVLDRKQTRRQYPKLAAKI